MTIAILTGLFAVLGVPFLIRTMQIAGFDVVDGHFGQLAQSRRKGVDQYDRNEWK